MRRGIEILRLEGCYIHSFAGDCGIWRACGEPRDQRVTPAGFPRSFLKYDHGGNTIWSLAVSVSSSAETSQIKGAAHALSRPSWLLTYFSHRFTQFLSAGGTREMSKMPEDYLLPDRISFCESRRSENSEGDENGTRRRQEKTDEWSKTWKREIRCM